MTREGNIGISVYKALVIASLIVAFPSHFIYYLAPFVVLLYAINKRLISLKRLITIFLLFTAFTLISFLTNYLVGESTNWMGYFWGTITYAQFFLVFSFKNNISLNIETINKVVSYIVIFALVQIITCFFQIFYGATWDNISGTFGLQDLLDPERTTLAQMMFAVNMLSIAAFLFTYLKRKWLKTIILLIFLMVAASQSGHATIFFIITFGFIYVIGLSVKRFFIGVLAILLFGIAVLFFFPETIQLAITWYSKVFEIDFPKIVIVKVLFQDIYNIKTFLLGTGVGQFSSKAALISSGDYLQVSLPSFLTGQSSFYKNLFLPVFDNLYRAVPFYSGSAIPSPTFSVVSILAEFGFGFSVLVFLKLLKEYRRNKKLMTGASHEQKMLARFLNFEIVFLVLCCCVENYAEFVQAIFLPLLLCIIAKARIRFLIQETKFE